MTFARCREIWPFLPLFCTVCPQILGYFSTPSPFCVDVLYGKPLTQLRPLNHPYGRLGESCLGARVANLPSWIVDRSWDSLRSPAVQIAHMPILRGSRRSGHFEERTDNVLAFLDRPFTPPAPSALRVERCVQHVASICPSFYGFGSERISEDWKGTLQKLLTFRVKVIFSSDGIQMSGKVQSIAAGLSGHCLLVVSLITPAARVSLTRPIFPSFCPSFCPPNPIDSRTRTSERRAFLWSFSPLMMWSHNRSDIVDQF